MIRTLKSSAAVVMGLALVSAGAYAADRPYEETMKEVGAACGSLKKNLDAKSNDAAGADAAKLEKLYKEVHKFWAKKKTDEAAKLSKDGQVAAKSIVKASKGGDAAAMSTGFQSLLATCKGCHSKYREKGPDGKWKIKA
ncbi:MAG: cytochrome c [Bryobacteraceae bacterium]